MTNEKIVAGVNIGETVEAFYNDRPDKPNRVTGIVIRNDDMICVIERTDVPPVSQFIDGKNVLVPLKAYIFGNTEPAVFNGGGVTVRKV